jgi:hypothetical protein
MSGSPSLMKGAATELERLRFKVGRAMTVANDVGLAWDECEEPRVTLWASLKAHELVERMASAPPVTGQSDADFAGKWAARVLATRRELWERKTAVALAAQRGRYAAAAAGAQKNKTQPKGAVQEEEEEEEEEEEGAEVERPKEEEEAADQEVEEEEEEETAEKKQPERDPEEAQEEEEEDDTEEDEEQEVAIAEARAAAAAARLRAEEAEEAARVLAAKAQKRKRVTLAVSAEATFEEVAAAYLQFLKTDARVPKHVRRSLEKPFQQAEAVKRARREGAAEAIALLFPGGP